MPSASSRAISAGSRVRWMHFVSAGREGFEAAGLPRGVTITYAAGAVAPTVAEHAMALLLALARRVPEMVMQGAESRWDRALATRAISLEGGTLVIVGSGHIGIEVARRARTFGMRTVGLSRRAAADPALDESLPLDQLHAALARADAVVIAIALGAEHAPPHRPRTTRRLQTGCADRQRGARRRNRPGSAGRRIALGPDRGRRLRRHLSGTVACR